MYIWETLLKAGTKPYAEFHGGKLHQCALVV
jgi:hypothetical protein